MSDSISPSAVDVALTAQLIVAWAGETGEAGRLRWWNCDLISEFGGEDLFKRLLPNTWDWAVLQGAREAAVREDAARRARDHEPDRIVSLFALGFENDERVEERLQALKRSGQTPPDALPGLVEIVGEDWDPTRLSEWAERHGKTKFTTVPSGRRIKGSPPKDLAKIIDGLIGALTPLAEDYPLPHFVRSV
jgi:hypothetical protein